MVSRASCARAGCQGRRVRWSSSAARLPGATRAAYEDGPTGVKAGYGLAHALDVCRKASITHCPLNSPGSQQGESWRRRVDRLQRCPHRGALARSSPCDQLVWRPGSCSCGDSGLLVTFNAYPLLFGRCVRNCPGMVRPARQTGAIHVSTTTRRSGDREYTATLLRRSYREDGKVKKETSRTSRTSHRRRSMRSGGSSPARRSRANSGSRR